MKPLPTLIVTFLFVFSCDSTLDAKMEISSVLESQVAAWNRGDIDGYMSGYWKNDSVRFASDADVIFGWQTVTDRYKAKYHSAELMGRLEFSNIDIAILSGNSAIAFGTWTLHREADNPMGLFTLVLRKTGTGWKIIHDHTSSKKQ